MSHQSTPYAGDHCDSSCPPQDSIRGRLVSHFSESRSSSSSNTIFQSNMSWTGGDTTRQMFLMHPGCTCSLISPVVVVLDGYLLSCMQPACVSGKEVSVVPYCASFPFYFIWHYLFEYFMYMTSRDGKSVLCCSIDENS